MVTPTETSTDDRIAKIVSSIRSAHDAALDGDLMDDDEYGETDIMLSINIADIAEAVGVDAVEKIPADLLERFCMMSVIRNEPSGLLLSKLLIGFIRAYSKHQTSEQAVQFMLALEQIGDGTEP